MIKKLKENNYEYTWGNVTVKLAEAFGFCWGVERAVQIAYEARKQFPEERIWITNEIIHNPTVNQVRSFWFLPFLFVNVGRLKQEFFPKKLDFVNAVLCFLKLKSTTLSILLASVF